MKTLAAGFLYIIPNSAGSREKNTAGETLPSGGDSSYTFIYDTTTHD